MNAKDYGFESTDTPRTDRSVGSVFQFLSFSLFNWTVMSFDYTHMKCLYLVLIIQRFLHKCLLRMNFVKIAFWNLCKTRRDLKKLKKWVAGNRENVSGFHLTSLIGMQIHALRIRETAISTIESSYLHPKEILFIIIIEY